MFSYGFVQDILVLTAAKLHRPQDNIFVVREGTFSLRTVPPARTSTCCTIASCLAPEHRPPAPLGIFALSRR